MKTKTLTPEIELEDLLILVTEITDTLIQQKHIIVRENLEFSKAKTKDPFSFVKPLQVEDG